MTRVIPLGVPGSGRIERNRLINRMDVVDAMIVHRREQIVEHHERTTRLQVDFNQ